MVLTFLHAMMTFRKGILINNHKYIFAGKTKLSLIFLGRNHPHYHQLISHEIRIEALMPHEICKLMDSSLVLSHTGRLGRYQSGDPIIEKINRGKMRYSNSA